MRSLPRRLPREIEVSTVQCCTSLKTWTSRGAQKKVNESPRSLLVVYDCRDPSVLLGRSLNHYKPHPAGNVVKN